MILKVLAQEGGCEVRSDMGTVRQHSHFGA